MPPIHYHKGLFPPAGINYEKLLEKLTSAHDALARYDGMLENVVNPDILLAPLMNREAEQSSRIEGTQATLRDVLEFEAGHYDADQSRKADIQEIRNYGLALQNAISELNDIPLSQRLIRNAHGVLMQGVRGQGSNPGDYRKLQNWIGPPNCEMDNAYFVPPPANELQKCMDEWESFMNKEQPSPLIQLAIVHAEFEAIHPFLDGNGRLGRLLIPIFLFEKGLIKKPSFYISEEFEKNRELYYDKLRSVSADNDWQGWCEFFLVSVANQSNRNSGKVRAILDLHEKSRHAVAQITGSPHAPKAVDYFFTRPIFSSSQFREETDIPGPTANTFLRKLREKDFLVPLREGKGRRAGIFAFPQLLGILLQ